MRAVRAREGGSTLNKREWRSPVGTHANWGQQQEAGKQGGSPRLPGPQRQRQGEAVSERGTARTQQLLKLSFEQGIKVVPLWELAILQATYDQRPKVIELCWFLHDGILQMTAVKAALG